MRSLGELIQLPNADAHAEITAHLDAGGDLRARDYTLLHWACVRGRLDLLERLIGLGLTVVDARLVDNGALREACAYGQLAVVNRLIELGLNAVDARAQNNFALRYACFYGHLAVVMEVWAAPKLPSGSSSLAWTRPMRGWTTTTRCA